MLELRPRGLTLRLPPAPSILVKMTSPAAYGTNDRLGRSLPRCSLQPISALQRLQSSRLAASNVRSGVPKGWSGVARCAALMSALRPLRSFAAAGASKPVVTASVEGV